MYLQYHCMNIFIKIGSSESLKNLKFFIALIIIGCTSDNESLLILSLVPG
jgi:hypothetical protein